MNLIPPPTSSPPLRNHPQNTAFFVSPSRPGAARSAHAQCTLNTLIIIIRICMSFITSRGPQGGPWALPGFPWGPTLFWSRTVNYYLFLGPEVSTTLDFPIFRFFDISQWKITFLQIFKFLPLGPPCSTLVHSAHAQCTQ